jgi:hypothetical protein
MITVHKYTLDCILVQSVEMPAGARVIAADNQHEELCAWAIVDTDRKPENRVFYCVETDKDATVAALKTSTFVNTVLFDEGDYIVHVFVRQP